MAGVKSIRALERGLDVLGALQTAPGAGLRDLHQITGLPKATLLRILKTLVERNLVWQRMADGAYLPSSRIRDRLPAAAEADRLVEIASPVMARLCERVNWPSILGVRADDQIEVIETNRPRSHVPHLPLGPVGVRVNMLLSAVGRAYFAFCGPEERAEIVARMRLHARPREEMPADTAWLARMVRETQARGYGIRDPRFLGETEAGAGPVVDDGRASIATPIIVGGQVIAALNLTWTRRAASAEHVIETCLGDLREAAAEIALGMG